MTDKPSLLMCKTIIGFGSPNKAGTHDSHGAPLGDAEIALTREALGWKHPAFEIPSEIYAQWDAKEVGQAKEAARTRSSRLTRKPSHRKRLSSPVV